MGVLKLSAICVAQLGMSRMRTETISRLTAPHARRRTPMLEPTPTRVQRRRTKGWRMPENTVYVGRPTKWGNNFVVGKNGTALAAVDHYRKHMATAAVTAIA